jgi:hypothetical protein
LLCFLIFINFAEAKGGFSSSSSSSHSTSTKTSGFSSKSSSSSSSSKSSGFGSNHVVAGVATGAILSSSLSSSGHQLSVAQQSSNSVNVLSQQKSNISSSNSGMNNNSSSGLNSGYNPTISRSNSYVPSYSPPQTVVIHDSSPSLSTIMLAEALTHHNNQPVIIQNGTTSNSYNQNGYNTGTVINPNGNNSNGFNEPIKSESHWFLWTLVIIILGVGIFFGIKYLANSNEVPKQKYSIN